MQIVFAHLGIGGGFWGKGSMYQGGDVYYTNQEDVDPNTRSLHVPVQSS